MMARIRKVYPLCVFLILASCGHVSQTAWAAEGRVQEGPSAFFSQGQAAFDPQNRGSSRKRAVQDFLTQAVSQAVGTILSPSQMATYYATLREKVFEQPERYVVRYQILSETVEKGNLFRIAGQVNIAMDVLREDLGRHGMSEKRGALPIPGSRGDGERILWAVAEHWGPKWYFPHGKEDAQGLFARSVQEQSAGFGWKVRYPPAGALSLDNKGRVDPRQVLALAKDAGSAYAVIGTMGLSEGENRVARAETTLGVYHVGSGKCLGELHKEHFPGGASREEGVKKLAGLVVSRLNRFFDESGSEDRYAVSRAAKDRVPAPPVTSNTRTLVDSHSPDSSTISGVPEKPRIPGPSGSDGPTIRESAFPDEPDEPKAGQDSSPQPPATSDTRTVVEARPLGPSTIPRVPEKPPVPGAPESHGPAGGEPASLGEPVGPRMAMTTTSVPQPRGEGLMLHIQSDRPHADWERLERMLREKFKSMQVVGFEFGADGGVIRLTGVQGSDLTALNGTSLQEGVRLHIEQTPSDSGTCAVTVVRSENHRLNQ